MFDELNKYKINDHFFYQATDSLIEVCNAPADKSGVYLVYALEHGRIELVYIGSSGKKLPDGNIKTRVAGLGGIKDRLVNGHHFGKTPRKKSWPIQMLSEDIHALDVYWWVTHDNKNKDCPLDVESIILEKYYEIYGGLPRWNKRLT
ncbi:MAG: hypothetical protein M3O71_09350 [Bacteroidota bacterium]|nr:hypothetical protein [Bacteroidota bacterium]